MGMPVNNFAGHGFYQFSPELAFRVLSPQYGFRILDAILIEPYRPSPRYFRVADPEAAGHRIPFRSDSGPRSWCWPNASGPFQSSSPRPCRATTQLRGRSRKPIRPRPRDTGTSRSRSSGRPPCGLGVRNRQRVMTAARRAVPKRIERSGPVMRLKLWMVWFIPSLQLQPHYAVDPPGFKPVHEPWTAPARPARRALPFGRRCQPRQPSKHPGPLNRRTARRSPCRSAGRRRFRSGGRHPDVGPGQPTPCLNTMLMTCSRCLHLRDAVLERRCVGPPVTSRSPCPSLKARTSLPPPGGEGIAWLSERHQGDNGIHDLGRYAVAVPGDAVGAVAVEIDAHRVEPDAIARPTVTPERLPSTWG